MIGYEFLILAAYISILVMMGVMVKRLEALRIQDLQKWEEEREEEDEILEEETHEEETLEEVPLEKETPKEEISPEEENYTMTENPMIRHRAVVNPEEAT